MMAKRGPYEWLPSPAGGASHPLGHPLSTLCPSPQKMAEQRKLEAKVRQEMQSMARQREHLQQSERAAAKTLREKETEYQRLMQNCEEQVKWAKVCGRLQIFGRVLRRCVGHWVTDTGQPVHCRSPGLPELLSSFWHRGQPCWR